jgi:colanic acid/amylovoran biosynthesis glycosyltransferase
MKVIVVTANLPHSTDEAFLVPEINELIRSGHQVLVVPRSPKGPIIHGQSLLKHTRRESLYSARVLSKAVRTAASSPVRAMKTARTLLSSRTPAVAAKNFAIMPKALWLSTLAREWGAEHIHSHWAGTTATLAMIASAMSGIPWSFTAHRWDVVENNLLAEKVQNARVARFISEDGLRMANQIGIGAATNARVLGMGVALPAEVRRRSSPWPIVLCPARLVEVKGHRFLLEAWRLMRDRGIHGELWLAGDGHLRPQLDSFAHSFGIHHSVKFLGTVPHDELMRIYRETPISIVVLASADLGNGVHEGIPVALVEAMSYGIPVVATETGGTPELVIPGTGFLVPAGKAAPLADAMQKLLQDRSLLQRVGESARRHVFETRNVVEVTSVLAKFLAGEPEAPRRDNPVAA